jgi:hypothetical protein
VIFSSRAFGENSAATSAIQALFFSMAGLQTSKLLFQRLEGDADADGLVVLGQDLAAQQRRHERRHPLLAIDEDALAGRRRSVFQPDCRIAPNDEVADGVASI